MVEVTRESAQRRCSDLGRHAGSRSSTMFSFLTSLSAAVAGSCCALPLALASVGIGGARLLITSTNIAWSDQEITIGWDTFSILRSKKFDFRRQLVMSTSPNRRNHSLRQASPSGQPLLPYSSALTTTAFAVEIEFHLWLVIGDALLAFVHRKPRKLQRGSS